MVKTVKQRFAMFAVALMALFGATLVAAPSASAASGTISGSIQCGYGNNQVVGVWVDAASGTDGWATTWNNGLGGKNYSYNLSQSSSYTLHVGCGGTPQNWGSSMTAGPVSGQYYDWVCTYGAATGWKYRCYQS